MCRICKKDLPLKRSKHFEKSKCGIELKKITAKELKPCTNIPFLLKEHASSDKECKVGKAKEISVKCSRCSSKYNSYAEYFQHKVVTLISNY